MIHQIQYNWHTFRVDKRTTEATPSKSFQDIIAMPSSMLEEQLKTGDYKQIQEFCRYLGISLKDARAELERRILEFKTKFDASETALPAGPPPESHVSVSTGGIV